jgi:predicted TIM-barrel fold metal-dependent hydrolase
MNLTKSAAIRRRLDHPILDTDGHMLEFQPAFLDYLKQIGGPKMVERYSFAHERGHGFNGALSNCFRWHLLSKEERFHHRVPRPPWWAIPTDALDRATAALPKLLYERLDELGIDLTILYPTWSLLLPHLEDEELRRVACRAFNIFFADWLREYADRMIPVALIPMHTPEEAIEELEYAVNALGLKVACMAGHVIRPISAIARLYPDASHRAFWLDTYGLDSAYDYDPVWAKCVELKIVPTQHSFGYGWGSRLSISNFVYNRIGDLASAGEALCKSLFLGGITRRFPKLKFAFMECGVGWACNLYSDLVMHWKLRNPQGLEKVNPAHLDRALLMDLCRRYGGKRVERELDQVGIGRIGGMLEDPGAVPDMLDEFAACQMERAEDIRELFVSHFYFGCEAEDPMNAWAFNTKVNPFGARLGVIFGSDIGHFDVPVMNEVVAEAYELVEQGLITEENFREFMFSNPVTLYAGTNPEFFRGTVVEPDVEKFLAGATT